MEEIIMYTGKINLVLTGFLDEQNKYKDVRLVFILDKGIVSKIFAFLNTEEISSYPLITGVPLSRVGDINSFIQSIMDKAGLGLDYLIKTHSIIGKGSPIDFEHIVSDKVLMSSIMQAKSIPYKNYIPVSDILRISSRALEEDTGCGYYW